MEDKENASPGDKGDKAQPAIPAENREHMIPKSRFDALNEKKKAAEAALEEIASGLTESIPEDMRDLVPNLPPAERVKWIQAARKKGFFTAQEEASGPDSKRPGDRPPPDFKNLSPQAIMERGYKAK